MTGKWNRIIRWPECIHELPKLRSAMPYHSMPCGCLITPLDTPCHKPLLFMLNLVLAKACYDQNILTLTKFFLHLSRKKRGKTETKQKMMVNKTKLKLKIVRKKSQIASKDVLLHTVFARRLVRSTDRQFQNRSISVQVSAAVSIRYHTINVDKDHNKKKSPRSKQDQLKERSATFYMTNQISKGPTLSRPIGRPGVGHSQGVFGVFNYYQPAISN
jgi:hypothetical protein